MTYPDLRGFLADLGNDLLKVSQPFAPKHEMAALLREMPANGPAVLFENVVRPDGTVFVPRGADPATWLAAFAAPLADDAPVSVVEGSP